MHQRLTVAASIVRKGLQRYGKQGLIILVSLVVAKIIGLFAQARAAVYLGSENYGVSGVFYQLAPFIVLLTNLHTNIVLVREYKKYKEANILERIISSTFSFRLIIFVIIALLTVPFLAGNISLLYCWLMALPFYANQVLRPFWLIQAQKRMYVHYLGMLIQTCMTAVCIFIFFKPGQYLGSDLIAYSLGGCVSLLIMWYLANKGMPRISFDKTALNDVKVVTLEAKWIILTAFCTVTYTSLELPLLVALSSPKEAGVYRTALSLSENLYTFLAFTNFILYPHLIEWHARGREYLQKMQNRILLVYGSFGLVLCISIAALAPLIYKILYDGVYDAAISQFRILVAAKVFMLLAGIYSWGLMASKLEKVILVILAPLSIITIISSIIFIPRFGSIASAYIALAFSVSFFTLTFLYNQRTSNS